MIFSFADEEIAATTNLTLTDNEQIFSAVQPSVDPENSRTQFNIEMPLVSRV